MKRLILLLSVLIASVPVFAQEFSEFERGFNTGVEFCEATKANVIKCVGKDPAYTTINIEVSAGTEELARNNFVLKCRRNSSESVCKDAAESATCLEVEAE